jgi:hypothetical protein
LILYNLIGHEAHFGSVNYKLSPLVALLVIGVPANVDFLGELDAQVGVLGYYRS